MITLSDYQGIAQFGTAYRIMLENDAAAPGSVDRVLLASMIRLCAETADYPYEDYTPTQVRYQRGARPQLKRQPKAVPGPDDYYRSILGMSARGWPGGLRWLYGEDDEN